jgi:hypothetical protein
MDLKKAALMVSMMAKSWVGKWDMKMAVLKECSVVLRKAEMKAEYLEFSQVVSKAFALAVLKVA